MSFKYQNEITVKVKCEINDIKCLLNEKGFKITGYFNMKDIYYVPKSLKLNDKSNREILSSCILLRYIKTNDGIIKRLTFKDKEYNSNGEIIKQKAINCGVYSITDANNFLKSIGYKKLMSIKEEDTVFNKDDIELCVKEVSDYTLIEIEEKDSIGLRTTNEIIDTLKKLSLPIEENNYFVKKAEIELDKIINKKSNM